MNSISGFFEGVSDAFRQIATRKQVSRFLMASLLIGCMAMVPPSSNAQTDSASSVVWLDMNRQDVFFIHAGTILEGMEGWPHQQDTAKVLVLIIGNPGKKGIESLSTQYAYLYGDQQNTAEDAGLLVIEETDAPFSTAYITQECWGEGEGTVCHDTIHLQLSKSARPRFASLFPSSS